MSHKKSYDENRMVGLAEKGLNPIKELIECGGPTDKLLALNLIFFFIIFGVIISFFLKVDFSDLGSIFLLFFGFLLSAILTGGYGYFVRIMEKAYKKKPVMWSIYIMIIVLPLSVWGLINSIKTLILISLVLVIFQVIFMMVTSLFFTEKKTEIKTRKRAWEVLGKTGIILGIVSSLITIGGIILRIVG